MSEQSSPQTAALPQPGSLMNGYEFMFILDPTLDDGASLAVVERVESIVKGQGGEIVSLKPWERRRLAYPIGGHHEGLYILCYFDAPPAARRSRAPPPGTTTSPAPARRSTVPCTPPATPIEVRGEARGGRAICQGRGAGAW